MDEIKWGIIGCGDVCEVKSAPAFNRIEGSRLVAVMRRNGDKARSYAERHGVPEWYDDADDLINDRNITAIYIATPPSTHMEYTLKAAAARKPVYVEKPMAKTHAECLSMIAACENANVPLFTAFYRRNLPNFLKVKSIIENGLIGDVRYVNVKLNKTLELDIVAGISDADNWRVNPEIAGGGYFYDLASHQMDFLDFLFGPIAEAHGFKSNQAGVYKAEDIVSGSFRFESGVLGQGVWCFSTSRTSDEELTVIVGSKGQLSFPFFGDHSVILEVEGQEKEIMSFEMPKHIQEPLIQTIVDELLGKAKCPSTGISGARTNWVMEQLTSQQ